MNKQQRLVIAISAGIAMSVPFAARGFVAVTGATVIGALVFDRCLKLGERYSRSRLMKLGTVPEKVPIRPILTLSVAAERSEIGGVIERAAAELSKGAFLKATDETYSRFEGTVPASIRNGYGELLTAAISPPCNGWHRVTLTSSPQTTRMAFTHVDFGRNFTNVRKIANACEAVFGVSRVREIDLKDVLEETP